MIGSRWPSLKRPSGDGRRWEELERPGSGGTVNWLPACLGDFGDALSSLLKPGSSLVTLARLRLVARPRRSAWRLQRPWPLVPNPNSNLPAFSCGAWLLLRRGHRHALMREALRETCGAARRVSFLLFELSRCFRGPIPAAQDKSSPLRLCTGIASGHLVVRCELSKDRTTARSQAWVPSSVSARTGGVASAERGLV